MRIAYWLGSYGEITEAWRHAFSITPSKYKHLGEALSAVGHDVTNIGIGETIDPNAFDCLVVPCWTLLMSVPLESIGALPLVLYSDGVYLNIMESAHIARTSLIFTTTQPRVEEYRSFLPDKPVVSVDYGITRNIQQETVSPYTGDRPVAVYVGRLAVRTWTVLMDLASRLPNVDFWIGGFATGSPMRGITGDRLSEVRSKANCYLISDVAGEHDAIARRFKSDIHGPVTYGAAGRFIKHADISLGLGHGKPPRNLPDHYGLACKIYGYWMQGTPSLVEHFGVQSLSVYPWNGVVFDGSINSAVKGIAKMLDSKYDRKRIAKWATVTYSWETVAERMTKHMEAIL